MAYIKKINGYVIKDEEARGAAAAAHQAANEAMVAAGVAQGRAEEAYALAEGRSKALVYGTFGELGNALYAMHPETSAGDINENDWIPIGTQLLIEEIDVPDYWVSGYLDTKKPFTTTGGGEPVAGEDTYEIGYYKISMLESEKVDLSGYATKTGSFPNMSVGSATSATNADKATKDASGNVITSTYATKSELNAEKITLKVASEELQILKDGVQITPTT